MTCKICGGPNFGQGYCQKHWRHAIADGTITSTRKSTAPPCSLDGCDTPTHAKGLCRLHYNQQVRGRPLVVAPPRDPQAACNFPGCDRPHRARGWCKEHHRQASRGYGMYPIGEAPRPEKTTAVCAFAGCDRTVRSNGLCHPHYQQSRRGVELHPIGPPVPGRRIGPRKTATTGNLPAGWDRVRPPNVHPKPSGGEIVVMVGSIPEDIWAEWTEAVEDLLRRWDALDLAEMLGLVAA